MVNNKRELKNAIGFSIGPIVSSAIGFIVTPIITHFISPEEYAKLNLYLLFQQILSVSIYLALDQSFVRFFNDRQNKKKLWRQTVFLPLLISSVLAVILIFNYKFISNYLFGINDNYLPIILFCVSIPLIVLERFILLWIRMSEKSFQYSFFSIMTKLAVLIITVLSMLFYEQSYVSAIYGYVLGQIIIDIILIVTNLNLFKSQKGTFNSDDFKEIFKYAIPLAPVALISLLLNSTDRMMLKELGTLTDVGLYSVALRITALLAILKNCITTFWTPMSLRWRSENVEDKQFTDVIDISVILFTIVFFTSLLFKKVIFIIFGNSYNEAMYIFPFLLFYPVLYTISEIFNVGLIFNKKGYILTISNLISLIVNIILNFLLIPKLGAIGAAMTTAVCNGLYFIIILHYSRKYWYKFPINKMMFSVILMYFCSIINAFVKIEYISLIINVICLIFILIIYKESIISSINFLKKDFHKRKKENINV